MFYLQRQSYKFNDYSSWWRQTKVWMSLFVVGDKHRRRYSLTVTQLLWRCINPSRRTPCTKINPAFSRNTSTQLAWPPKWRSVSRHSITLRPNSYYICSEVLHNVGVIELATLTNNDIGDSKATSRCCRKPRFKLINIRSSRQIVENLSVNQ